MVIPKNCKRSKQLDIEFENIWLSVKIKRGLKYIIQGVSGKFNSGELTGIMGPSGAGKTSLLNILTGYQKSGIEGTIKCSNGRIKKSGASQYKKDSCYILQDDHLMNYFTVYEIMYSTAKLKISGLNNEKYDFLIRDILNSMGLLTPRNTLCADLSGGQKKRLSIALELIDDPQIMFLDEPTTGLDSSSSRQCVELLKSLAEKGRTIICTIHQPSAPIFMTFDHMYIMADGKCAYQGAPLNTVPFLSSVGYLCPQYHNPADFMLEILNKEYGNCLDKLVEASDPNNWRSINDKIELQIKEPVQEIMENDGQIIEYIEEKNYSLKPPSEWQRFLILCKKQLICLYRDWTVGNLKLLLHFLVGIFLGCTFKDAGNNGSKAISNISLFMIGVLYLSYTSLMPAVLRFPLELSILRKEHFNRWYKLRTYYASVIAIDTPLQVMFCFSYILGSYTISAQPLELNRFLMVLAIFSMATIISSGAGSMFGALLNPVNGTFIAAILVALNTSLAGIFCFFPHMNRVLYFLSNFAYFSYSVESILQAVYGYNREHLECPEEEEYCLFTSPTQLLENIGMNNLSYWVNFSCLMVNLLIFKLLAYFSLKYKLKTI